MGGGGNMFMDVSVDLNIVDMTALAVVDKNRTWRELSAVGEAPGMRAVSRVVGVRAATCVTASHGFSVYDLKGRPYMGSYVKNDI